MECHEIHAANLVVIVLFNNVFIGIELETVVPVVRVGEFFNQRVRRCLTKRICFCDFFTAFPVINEKSRRVGRVFEKHIHGPGKFGWFVVNHPFCAKWGEMLVVFCEIKEVVLVFGASVLVWRAIVETFNVKMEASSRSRRRFAILGPLLFDLVGSFAVILAGWPLGRANHVGYDFVGVELLELGVIEGGDGCVIGITVNRVFVVCFFELNVVIAGMAVDEGEFERIIGSFGHESFI